ncbi:MAG: hypothetical protein HZC36_05645 [Armatimonadetes bacterium]|nr:hypothetical protein [Armatimonadota bacterium]
MKMTTRFGVRPSVGTLALASAMLASLTGCGKDPVFRIVGVDTSGSAQADLGKYRRITYKLVRELRPGTDAVRVIRFDYEPHEILRTLGQRKEALWTTLETQLKIPAERRGTRLARFYDEVARLLDSPEAQDKRIELFIASDNGNDDGSKAMAELSDRAARKIASDPRVERIHYWGVKARLREEIPGAFSKLPDSVLIVQGATEEFAKG